MADRMFERERGGSMGLIGVIVGALLVIALAFFLINGDYFRGGGTTASVSDGAKTSAPASSGPATTGSTPAPASPAPASPAR